MSDAHTSQVRPDPVRDEVTEGHTFRILAALIEKLKQLAQGYHGANTQSWISTHDAVCALIWSSIMRARSSAGLLREARKQSWASRWTQETADPAVASGLHGQRQFRRRRFSCSAPAP